MTDWLLHVPMWACVTLFGVGIALIMKGGDYFVGSSVGIARFAHIPHVVIGSTLVSIATTSPELVVSATAAYKNEPTLALGNAVGSCICNVALILGLLAILVPVVVRKQDFRLPSRVMIAAGVILTAMTAWLTLERWCGIVLLAFGIGYLAFDYFRHQRSGASREQGEDDAGGDPRMRTLTRCIIFFAIGLVLVVIGSNLMVINGTRMADALGVPQVVIGLTAVAIGTSLPELVTAITAAMRKVADLSLGNLIGANIMNLTLVIGTTATIRPLTLKLREYLFIFPTMLLLFVIVIWQAKTKNRISRREGWFLLGYYAVYFVVLVFLFGASGVTAAG